MDKNERERKQLNRKLIWKTFVSECRHKKKRELFADFMYEFFSFLTAIVLAGYISGKLHQNFWLPELVIFILISAVIHVMVNAVRKRGRIADR